AVISINKLDLMVRKTQWISAASAELIDTRQHIPSGSEHDEQRRQLKHKLIKSLRNDCEQWWVAKAKEMEQAAAIGNKLTLSSSDFSGVDLFPGDKLTDLEYADGIVLLSEDADKMQNFLTTLNLNVSMFGMRFSPSKCKMLLQDWLNSAPKLVIGGETIECVNRFTYLGSLISPNGLVSDEISARIHKARSAFANLRHLWRRRDIRLMTKG
ncbi:polyprotein, partial [Schistosoma japonicum]